MTSLSPRQGKAINLKLPASFNPSHLGVKSPTPKLHKGDKTFTSHSSLSALRTPAPLSSSPGGTATAFPSMRPAQGIGLHWTEPGW